MQKIVDFCKLLFFTKNDKRRKSTLHIKYLAHYEIYRNQWGVTIHELEALFKGEISGFGSCKTSGLNRSYLTDFSNEKNEWTEIKMNHFFNSLKRCFRYDFEVEYDEEKDEHKEYRKNLLKALKSYKPSASGRKNKNDNSNNSQESSQVESQVYENLKGKVKDFRENFEPALRDVPVRIISK